MGIFDAIFGSRDVGNVQLELRALKELKDFIEKGKNLDFVLFKRELELKVNLLRREVEHHELELKLEKWDNQTGYRDVLSGRFSKLQDLRNAGNLRREIESCFKKKNILLDSILRSAQTSKVSVELSSSAGKILGVFEKLDQAYMDVMRGITSKRYVTDAELASITNMLGRSIEYAGKAENYALKNAAAVRRELRRA